MRDGILMADRQKVNMSAGSEDTAALIAKFTPMIRAKAARMKTGSIETDDLVSEGFLGLLSAIRCYKPEKGSFGAFASVCIANRMKNAVTRSVSKGAVPVSDDFDFSELADDAAGTEELVIMKEQNSEIYSQIENILSGMERFTSIGTILPPLVTSKSK